MDPAISGSEHRAGDPTAIRYWTELTGFTTTENNVKVVSGQVVGEKGDTSDIVIQGRWPSDHRAVVIEYKWKN